MGLQWDGPLEKQHADERAAASPAVAHKQMESEGTAERTWLSGTAEEGLTGVRNMGVQARWVSLPDRACLKEYTHELKECEVRTVKCGCDLSLLFSFEY